MKIAFISLYDHDSLGIRILHSLLKKNNYDVRSYFLKRTYEVSGNVPDITEKEFSILVKSLQEFNPSIVGISLRSTTFGVAVEVTKRIRERINTYIVWGGNHPTLSPEQCIKHADIICVGEGEEVILELADRIAGNNDFLDVQNLWIRNKDGSIIKNDLRLLISNIDKIPYPDFSDDDKFYILKNKIKTTRPRPLHQYNIITMRGCPFNCTYCSNVSVKELYSKNNKGKFLRKRSVKNVIDELLYAIKKYRDIRRIRFYDDIFTLDKEWLRRICEEYKEKIGLPFFCYPHPQMADEEMIMMLKDAGLDNTKVGVQSGSDYIRNEIFGRKETKEEILNFARILNKHKLIVVYDLIIDCPLETEIDYEKNLELLLELPKPFKVYVHQLCYYPGAKISEMALQKKLITEEMVVGSNMNMVHHGTLPLDLKEDKNKIFWCSLYYLTGKRYIPNRVIIFISKSKLLRRYSWLWGAIIHFLHRVYLYIYF